MLKSDQFYCVKCRAKVKASNEHLKMIKNSKVGSIPSLQGKCKRCGTKVVKFVKKSKVASLRKSPSLRKSKKVKSRRRSRM